MNEPARRSAIKALDWIIATAVAAMIFSVYSNTFASPPFLDDFHAFIFPKALYIHSLSISALISLANQGWTRFLPTLSFALNHFFGHDKLVYFHAVNILIHLLAFFAVFWFVKEVLRAEQRMRPDGEEAPYAIEDFFPLCVAALWALSPVQTSSVTYLVQRIASMQALFFTLSTACFIRARLLSERKVRRASFFYFLCALSGLCAGLSKENSAMLPVVLAAIDIWFFESAWLKKGVDLWRKTGWKLRSCCRCRSPFIFLLCFFCGAAQITCQLFHKGFHPGRATDDRSAGGRLVHVAHALAGPIPAGHAARPTDLHISF